MHAVEGNGNHLSRPRRIEAAIRILERLGVRVDEDGPCEVLLRRVDGSRCTLSTTLLAELVEGSPKLIELLGERVSWYLVEGAGAVALTLTEGHLLDSDRLRHASQRGSLRSLVVVSYERDRSSRADGSMACSATGVAVGGARGIAGASRRIVDAEAKGAGLLK